MENVLGAILSEVDGELKSAVNDRVRSILGDDYDLIPTDLNEHVEDNYL